MRNLLLALACLVLLSACAGEFQTPLGDLRSSGITVTITKTTIPAEAVRPVNHAGAGLPIFCHKKRAFLGTYSIALARAAEERGLIVISIDLGYPRGTEVNSKEQRIMYLIRYNGDQGDFRGSFGCAANDVDIDLFQFYVDGPYKRLAVDQTTRRLFVRLLADKLQPGDIGYVQDDPSRRIKFPAGRIRKFRRSIGPWQQCTADQVDHTGNCRRYLGS